MKLYLAGPMSGIEAFNYPAFHEAAARLRDLGHDVVNPAEVNPDTSIGWAECMRRDIPPLLSCEGIAMLPGWENSRGASLEHHIASKLGMHVFTLDDLLD